MKSPTLPFYVILGFTFLENHAHLAQANSIFDSLVEPMTDSDASETTDRSSSVVDYESEFDEDGRQRVLILYKDEEGKDHATSLSASGQLDVDLPKSRIASVRVTKEQKAELQADPHIEKVEFDPPRYAMVHEKGPFISLEDYYNMTEPFVDKYGNATSQRRRMAESTPYGIFQVQANKVPPPPTTNPRMKVCVVDTGYGNGHPDLPNIADHGVRGFTPSDMGGIWKVDGHSQGTHCAGTIGAIGGNDKGVVGVLDDPETFKFYIGKGLGDQGSGSSAGVLEAVQACVDAGAKIISMSLGGVAPTSIIRDEYKKHYDNGVLIIAAAGNLGNSDKNYPASYEYVMSVAATDISNKIAYFSQHNSQVEISGPGVSTMSTITTNNGEQFGYALYSGTSMATPHVAGVAALVWSHFPTCSNRQIRNVLLTSAMDLGDDGCDPFYGFGLVQAKAAYDLLASEGCGAGGGKLGAIGGCEQIPADPPAPPGPCESDQVELEVRIRTDEYPTQTSWKLWDIYGKFYVGDRNLEVTEEWYKYRKCVPPGVYKFRILDSHGDGFSSSGKFKILMDGQVQESRSGNFGKRVTKTFPKCMDDPNLKFEDKSFRDCNWVGRKSFRCNKKWKKRALRVYCPVACGKCTP